MASVMLSSFGIRACQAEAPREGMAYSIFIESFLARWIFSNPSSSITPDWLVPIEASGGSDTLPLKCGMKHLGRLWF